MIIENSNEKKIKLINKHNIPSDKKKLIAKYDFK